MVVERLRRLSLIASLAASVCASPVFAQHAEAERAAAVPPAVAAERCPPETPADPRRRSATVPVIEYEPTPCNPAQLPAPTLEQIGGFEGLPDRWRLVEAIGIKQNLLDPYHGYNVLKGDRPAFGEDWYFAVVGVSDTVIEPREFPVPVGGPVTDRAGALEVFTKKVGLLKRDTHGREDDGEVA